MHTHIHTYTYIDTYIDTYIHTHMHTYIQKTIHTHAYMHTYIHTYMHTKIYIWLHKFTCNHVRIHTYIHTYTNTHVYTYMVLKIAGTAYKSTLLQATFCMRMSTCMYVQHAYIDITNTFDDIWTVTAYTHTRTHILCKLTVKALSRMSSSFQTSFGLPLV